MRTVREDSFDAAFRLLDTAFTQNEIEAAQEAMEQHLEQYPDDIKREPWHGWSSTVEASRERKAQSALLGLTPAQHATREQFVKDSYRVGDVIGQPENVGRMEATASRLLSWLLAYPEDRFVAERHERLAAEITLAQQLLATLALSTEGAYSP